MSIATRTRTTPDSAVETTEPRRRAIDPEEPVCFDFCDFSDALLENLPPPFLPESPIYELMQGNVIGLISRYANAAKHDSATQRWDKMKADASLEYFLDAATSVFDILSTAAFRHLKIKKMSHTISQTTEPKKKKRRAIEAREQKPIDPIDPLFKDLPLAPIKPKTYQYTIAYLKEHVIIEEFLDVLENTPNQKEKASLVEKAKEFLASILKSAEGVESFSNLVREAWSFLAFGIRDAIDSWRRVDVVGLGVRCANRDSATQRWALMKDDPSLQSSLADILKTPATSEIDILRLFLSILFAYWADLAELPKLDAAIGRLEAGFRFHVYLIELVKADPPWKPPHRTKLVSAFRIERGGGLSRV